MSRSEITLRDLRDLQTEMRKTEFASERGRKLLAYAINFTRCSILNIEKACPQVISAKSDWLFKGSKSYRLFFFLQAVGKLTANDSVVLRIEPLEQSTVNLLYLACSTRILHRKLFTSFFMLAPETVVIWRALVF